MRHALVAAAILGVGIPALAQSGNTHTYHDTIIVTASLKEVARGDSPASVSVVSGEELADRQATEAAKAIESVPGLYLVQLGSPGKAATLFVRGAASNQTLVLWNGVPLNDPFFGGFDWAFLPTDGAERIEVVRGPFSALYGSEAIGGVVQVLTARQRGGRARLEGGSDAYRRAAIGAGFDPGPLHLDVLGHLRRGDGQVDNDFYDGEEGVVRGRWSSAAGLGLGFLARTNRSRVGIPFDFLGRPSPDRRQRRTITSLALPVNWASGAWSLDSQLDASRGRLVFRDPADPFSSADTDTRLGHARAVATYRAGAHGWGSFGGEWERQEATNRPEAGDPLAAVAQRTWAGFGELGIRAGSFSLEGGLRRDANSAFGSETTAKLGATWAASDRLRLRASYGEGFRAPSLGDLYFPGFGNPDLKPELSASWELGLDAEWGPLAVSLAGFHTDLENLILFDPVRFLPENIGRARSRGVEAELDYATARAHVRLAATYLDSVDRATGRPLPRRPRLRGDLVATLHPRAAWTVFAAARHVGSRSDIGDVQLAAATTFDAGASFRWRHGLEPYARLENLLDRSYQEAAGFPAPGRTWVAGITLRRR